MVNFDRLKLAGVAVWWALSYFMFGFSALVFANYQVNFNNGQKISTLSVQKQDGFEFVAFQDFALALDARTYFSEKTKCASMILGAQEIKVSALNPFILIDNRIYQMPLDTRFFEADIYLPLKFLIQILKEYSAITIEFDESNRQLNLSYHNLKNITDLAFESKLNGILLKIYTTRQFQASEITTRLRNQWVYIDLYGGSVDSARLTRIALKSPIQQILPTQVSANLAQISVQISAPILDVKASAPENSNFILVSIRTQETLPDKVLKDLENDRKKWQIDKIVLDPGHGGKDPGAIGPSGVREKDVVLKIAKKAQQLLESQLGIEVYMTREGDQFVPLNQRTAMANRVGAKIFISIHANSNPNRRVNGISTYILGPAKTEEAIEVARFENSVIRLEATQDVYPQLDDEQFILSAIAQSEFTRESEELAAMLQATTTRRTGLSDRGVKQAGYYVLIGASMPNILFETAFISNKNEEKKLNSATYQQQFAEGILESVRLFKQKYEKSNSGYSTD